MDDVRKALAKAVTGDLVVEADVVAVEEGTAAAEVKAAKSAQVEVGVVEAAPLSAGMDDVRKALAKAVTGDLVVEADVVAVEEGTAAAEVKAAESVQVEVGVVEAAPLSAGM